MTRQKELTAIIPAANKRVTELSINMSVGIENNHALKSKDMHDQLKEHAKKLIESAEELQSYLHEYINGYRDEQR
jgi:hypothetical protein